MNIRAEASTTEEPDAGKPHVRVCAGGAGQPAFLPCDKRYMNSLHDSLPQSKSLALEANKEVFSDSHNLKGIFRYIETGQFPWED